MGGSTNPRPPCLSEEQHILLILLLILDSALCGNEVRSVMLNEEN
jgi:hypothetical protein